MFSRFFTHSISIRLIFRSIVVFLLFTEGIYIFVLAREYIKHQEQRVEPLFSEILDKQTQAIDQEILDTKKNLIQLKDNLEILDIAQFNTPQKLQLMRSLMAKALQPYPNQYNCYFAFEPILAQKYFQSNAYVFTVHKNYADLGTKKYGDPARNINEVWTDPGYLTNSKEVWYHVTKKSQNPEVTPIYYDETYMKTWLYTVGLGLYNQKNQFQGMVGIDLLVESFFHKIEAQTILKTGGLFLVDLQTGNVLTRVDRPKQQSQFLLIKERLKYNLYQDHPLQEKWKTVLKKINYYPKIKGVDGKDYFVISHPLSQLPLTLVAYIQSQEINQPLYEKLFFLSIFGGLGLSFLAMLLSLTFRKIDRSIEELINKMKALNNINFNVLDNDLKYYLAPIGGIAETRELGIIFNEMTRHLYKILTDLETTNNQLEIRVKERTKELEENNQELGETLDKLKQAQLQLIQSEKMSSLGQLVAGIAHEINNPINFIHGNLTYAESTFKDLLEIISLYESFYEDTIPEVQTKLENLDFEFLKEDTPRLLYSMKTGTERVRSIVLSLRNFSRLDEETLKTVDLHEGLDNTLLILDYRISSIPNLAIIKNYGELPLVECYAGLINQVFLNLLTNALDTLENKLKQEGIDHFAPCIWINTQNTGYNRVKITIRDNGLGIPQTIHNKIFDPFFTTKPVGKGTGLGLSMSYSIIQQHQGRLSFDSLSKGGSSFTLEIPVFQMTNLN